MDMSIRVELFWLAHMCWFPRLSFLTCNISCLASSAPLVCLGLCGEQQVIPILRKVYPHSKALVSALPCCLTLICSFFACLGKVICLCMLRISNHITAPSIIVVLCI